MTKENPFPQSFGVTEIMTLIPHRPPFLLVDRVEQWSAWKKLVAYWQISICDPNLGGHFPGQPMVPGVLMIEALNQAAAILGFLSNYDNQDKGDLFVLAGLDRARFKRMVRPGDTMRLEVGFQLRRRNLARWTGLASVAGETACKAEILSFSRTA